MGRGAIARAAGYLPVATIKQVAERAGVSAATVSYVLNGTGTVTEATRRRVLAAVAELNYQPSHAARSLRGRSQTLGLVLPGGGQALAEPLLAEVLAGLCEAAAARGYAVLLAAPGPDQEPATLYAQLVRSARVDGLVLLDPLVDDERGPLLASLGVPRVWAGPAPADPGSPVVEVDGRGGAAVAVRHLLALGHRRIALIALPSELAESEPRFEGYAAALEAAGLALDPELVIEAGRTQDDGYEAMRELLALPEPPTAVLACSDTLAFGAMHALRDDGREVGRDVSVVGFDDAPLAAHAYPALTSLHRPRQETGLALARLVIDAIAGRPGPASITLPMRLIVRKSTGVCRDRIVQHG